LSDLEETEEALVGKVIAGDRLAEEKFFGLFRPRLYRASMYFLGGQDSEAEDIVQDTFIIALPKLKDYVFKAPIYAWLRQICLHLCYARLHKRSRMLVTLEEDLELFMRRMASERLQNQDLEVAKQERLAVLRELITLLNPVSREIINLRNVQGMSYIKISQALQIPLGTVMSRLARARDQIRELAKNPQEKAEAPAKDSNSS
jgi:RNA polymerase sigma-70 factor (ECF subfamily)